MRNRWTKQIACNTIVSVAYRHNQFNVFALIIKKLGAKICFEDGINCISKTNI